MEPDQQERRYRRQVGSALRRFRLQRGESLARVADFVGISAKELLSYELGEQYPDPGTLRSVLAALNAALGEFEKYLGPWGSVEQGKRR